MENIYIYQLYKHYIINLAIIIILGILFCKTLTISWSGTTSCCKGLIRFFELKNLISKNEIVKIYTFLFYYIFKNFLRLRDTLGFSSVELAYHYVAKHIFFVFIRNVTNFLIFNKFNVHSFPILPGIYSLFTSFLSHIVIRYFHVFSFSF